MLTNIFLIVLFVLSFVGNIIFTIRKYLAIKNIRNNLVAESKYPTGLSSGYSSLRFVTFVFLGFSVLGSLSFFFGGNDQDVALQFSLFVALPFNVFATVIGFWALSKWDRFWVFDKDCLYIYNTEKRYYYLDFQFIHFDSSNRSGDFVEIRVAGKHKYISILNQYENAIKSRMPEKVCNKSEKIIKSNKKYVGLIFAYLTPISAIGVVLFLIGAFCFLSSAEALSTSRDFSTQYKSSSQLPISGGVLTQYNDNLYVYCDMQGGVNVYDLNGNFKYAFLVDYRANGQGGLFMYKNLLYIQSRSYNNYVIENDKLIDQSNDNSLNEALNSNSISYINTKTINNNKYSLAPFGDLIVNGKIIHTTAFYQWLINTPFACWGIAFLGMVLIGFNKLLMFLKQNHETAKQSKNIQ